MAISALHKVKFVIDSRYFLKYTHLIQKEKLLTLTSLTYIRVLIIILPKYGAYILSGSAGKPIVARPAYEIMDRNFGGVDREHWKGVGPLARR